MRYRGLGRTALPVSELALGTAPFAAPGFDRDAAKRVISAALDGGVNLIELDAGQERAVGLLGDPLPHSCIAGNVLLVCRTSSLVPFDLPSPHIHAQCAFPGAHIRAQTESLLKTFGLERLGAWLLHAWCPEWLHEGDWLETLVALRDEGKIAAFGVSLFDHDVDAALEVVAGGAIDIVEVMYNIFDQGAAPRLLPLCQCNGVGVIARSPFYFGALAARLDRPLPAGDWRDAYFFDAHRRETRMRAAALADSELRDDDPADLALRFVLSHPAISSVAAGMSTEGQVAANLQSCSRGPLSPAGLASLGAHRWLC